MNSLRIGRSLCALRIRRGWRQADVSAAAGISGSQYSRIERGELRGVPLDDVDAACRALGADLDVRVRWHGEGLDRLLDAAHAELVDAIVARLQAHGWETAVEVTFNHFGERGSIDVVGWHPVSRAILIVEVKSVVPDPVRVHATIPWSDGNRGASNRSKSALAGAGSSSRDIGSVIRQLWTGGGVGQPRVGQPPRGGHG